VERCEFESMLGGGFYRPERAGKEVAEGGGPAACVVQRRARWLWRLAGVRGCALWSGHARAGVLERVETEGREGRERRGVRLLFFLSSGSHGRGPGCSSAGSTAERARVSSGTAMLARSYGGGVIYSRFGFSENCSPSVRSNARKNFKFKFLKTSTVGCHHIGQGFQRYFC
jgi:hypothetical protein